ncbi:hypothetical protein RXV86_08040 [Alisedimentitalea sp. MJ-SS2]|uniref:hypothetical protein n=1 Tax=Aliisedimentitalea sp. MJ-SS2 TaxID=3049795 RepID=UPI00291586CF|nr:hypothetical protein [Alisedimentitalea sp. MJ-SS2]MDU8927332.1 hypothetical protein [Alisedimentitalea sp. MJ-SS2]
MKFIRLFLLFAFVAVFRLIGLVLNLLSPRATARHLPDTLRLYRRTPDGTEFLWFYEIGEQLFVDAGMLGKNATRASFAIEHWPAIKEHIRVMREKGFEEIATDAMQFLQITYHIRGDFAEKDELDKRNALLDKLDEFLALTGQGYWVDASSGSGTMELGFEVVDFDIAETTLREQLKGSEYDNFLTITPNQPQLEGDDKEIVYLPA